MFLNLIKMIQLNFSRKFIERIYDRISSLFHCVIGIRVLFSIIFPFGCYRCGSIWWMGSVPNALNCILCYNEPLNPDFSAVRDCEPKPQAILNYITFPSSIRDISFHENLAITFVHQPFRILIKEFRKMLCGEFFSHRFNAKATFLFRHPVPVFASTVKLTLVNVNNWLACLLCNQVLAGCILNDAAQFKIRHYLS